MDIYWGDFMSVLKDIVIIFAAISGAVVAILGLSTWKRQLKGKVEYDLAKKILKLLVGLQKLSDNFLKKLRDTFSKYKHFFSFQSLDFEDVLFA